MSLFELFKKLKLTTGLFSRAAIANAFTVVETPFISENRDDIVHATTASDSLLSTSNDATRSSNKANTNTLAKAIDHFLSNCGRNLSSVHTLDFPHLFSTYCNDNFHSKNGMKSVRTTNRHCKDQF